MSEIERNPLESPKMSFANGFASELEAVEQVMLALVRGDLGVDPMGEICGYHLGSGGRRLRARLSLAACAALGGKTQAAVNWGAACELLHNATLVHDDLQDGDRSRRGKPTVWVKYGMPQAINAGDLMLMVPIKAVRGIAVNNDVRWQLADSLADAAETVVRGQAEEFTMIDRLQSGQLQQIYLDMVKGKTSALFSLPLYGSALIAGLNQIESRRLAAAAQTIGVVFQICDDVIDFQGRKGRGRRAEDLREGKVSSLWVKYLGTHGHRFSDVEAFLRTPREFLDEGEVERWIEGLSASGVERSAVEWAQDLAGEAMSEIKALGGSEIGEVVSELTKAILQQVEV